MAKQPTTARTIAYEDNKTKSALLLHSLYHTNNDLATSQQPLPKTKNI